MKNMRRIFYISAALSAAFILLATVISCNDIFSAPGGNEPASSGGKVIIRIAGSDGRTILPQTPVFSKYKLFFGKKGEVQTEVDNPAGIESDGVYLDLSEGKWTITLEAYQDVFKDGRDILAAKGSAEITVYEGEGLKPVFITLKPVPIKEANGVQGLFSFTIINLPQDVQTAVLKLENEGGFNKEFDLINENSGSIPLNAGYYDLSVLLEKNGQKAGLFESVHIYSGLESPADIDLSDIVFVDKVYLTGTLDGIRLGTIQIFDGNKTLIEEFDTDNENKAERTAVWITDIPSSYIGETVYITQVFDGEETDAVKISPLEASGKDGINLSLIPSNAQFRNIAPWYSTATSINGENPQYAADADLLTHSTIAVWDYNHPTGDESSLELDFGFDVTVNAAQIVFYSQADAVLPLDTYTLKYCNGSSWVQVASQNRQFTGSTDGSVKYSDFFTEVTAQKFRWTATSKSGSGDVSLAQFGLFKAAERGGLKEEIRKAKNYLNITYQSDDGTDIDIAYRWVTPKVHSDYSDAVDAAQAVYDDPCKTDDEITRAEETLRDRTGNAGSGFVLAREWGSSGSIDVVLDVQDGYANKFVLTWTRVAEREYELYKSIDGEAWTLVTTYPDQPGSGEAEPEVFTVQFTEDITPDMTWYFGLKPYIVSYEGINRDRNPGEMSVVGPKYTIGIPRLHSVSSTYSTITVKWYNTYGTDAYRIIYQYTGESSNHSQDVPNNLTPTEDVYTYAFRPNGCDDAAKSGKEIQVSMEALNDGLWKQVGGDPIKTTSVNKLPTKLVGPALLNPSASKAASVDKITVSWDKVEGAGGYYVFRRQFNMNNTAQEGTAVYYVAESGSVTGKGLVSGADTTTVKAAASVSGSQFTLTDSWMTDTEYNGAYSGYGTYRDQQNDIAQGKAYRYFIVPVLAGEQLNSISYTGGGAYTIQDVTVINAASLEKTGFTVGFGQNVTATKGSYASSGNVNNGIQITWSAPPLLAGVGYNSPQYTLYRKSVNGLETVGALGNVTTYVDTTAARGVAYDYLVGIAASQPGQSERFADWCRTQVNAKNIPLMRGYMLDMVKMDSVSRGEDATVNAEYGERVTWETGAVRVDGYTIYVMNRNINADWHQVTDDITASQTLNSTQNFVVKPNITATAGTGIANVTGGNARTATISTTQGDMTFDLLRVMRDYKHFFKVRSYVNGPSGKVYCPDPGYTYTYRRDTDAYNADPSKDPFNTDYVKWGARQITSDEFIKIVSVFAGRGVCDSWTNGAAVAGSSYDKTSNASTTNGGSGSVKEEYRYQTGGTDAYRTFKYSNYKQELPNRVGQSITFITIDGNIWSRSYGYSAWPFRYGEDNWVTIRGPWDTPSLYTGQIIFGKNVSGNNTGFSWNGNGTLSGGTSTGESGSSHQARVAVKYPGTVANPGAAAEQQIPYRGQDTALQFKEKGATRYQLEDYK